MPALAEKSLSSYYRWMITVSVMLVAVIEVIDMTIVNVALPDMMGTLGANTDQITWVLTAYIVSSAVCMPLTGFLVARIGRKRLLLINIVGFLVSSMLCGMAENLAQIVFFRVLQGVFGATLVPMSQYILRDTFPKNQQGKAMAIWSMGIMLGPVLGPTLGGYITDILNWRWIFYVNVPVCIIAVLMTMRFISETPRDSRALIDWFGLTLMALGIGAMQVFLDRGNQNNWFNSNQMLILFCFAVYILAVFIYRGWFYKDNIINLHLVKERNFSVATLILSIYCALFLGLITLQPIMMQSLYNYPVLTSGLVMAPRGLASAVMMILVVKIINRVDLRLIITAGLLFSVVGTYEMTKFNLNTSESFIIWSSIIQGFGAGMVFVPLSMLSLANIEKKNIAEASGLYSFGRSIGSSVGISLFSTLLSRESQINWNHLSGYVTPSNPNFKSWLSSTGLNIHQASTVSILGTMINKQSVMIAFIDCYWLAFVGFLAMLLLIPLLGVRTTT